MDEHGDSGHWGNTETAIGLISEEAGSPAVAAMRHLSRQTLPIHHDISISDRSALPDGRPLGNVMARKTWSARVDRWCK